MDIELNLTTETVNHASPAPPVCVTGDISLGEAFRQMRDRNSGSLLVCRDGVMVGIFTERDALNKVLASNLDPGNTKVSEVMTKDPYCIGPATTVGDAMQLITERRFRHLPIVENGKVLAVVSSGDLTRWLVQDQMGEVQELVSLAAR